MLEGETRIARDHRTNRRIRAREVRVVGPGGEQYGVLAIEAAQEKAQEFGLDLVEVNPMAKPPVCKIMDYGKFKYEEKKKASEAKKKQVVVHLKEVKLRPKTEEHDYEFKVRNVKRFLEEGNKARVTIMFRGREITHRELGQRILEDVVQDVKEVGIVEQAPRMEGRQMFMILAPNPKVAQRARDLARQQALKEEQAAAAAAAAAGAPAQAQEAKPEPKQEAKPESKQEAKPEPKQEAKPEPSTGDGQASPDVQPPPPQAEAEAPIK